MFLKRATSKKLCSVLIAIIMMLQIALIPITVWADPEPGVTVAITPMVGGAEPGDRVSVIVDLIPLSNNIGYSGNPGVVTAIFDVFYDNSRLQFHSWSFFDNCPARAAGLNAIVTPDPSSNDLAPAGMRPLRIMRTNRFSAPITFNAPIMLHFDVRNDAPQGDALVMWSVETDTHNRLGATSYAGAPGGSQMIPFRPSTDADFGRILISPDLNITITPDQNQANPGDTVSIVVDLIPLRNGIIGNPANPGVVTAVFEILFDNTRLAFAGWNYYPDDNCPAKLLGFEALVNPTPGIDPQLPPPPGMSHINVMRTSENSVPITTNAPIELHFTVLADAPLGEALVSWRLGRFSGAAGLPGGSPVQSFELRFVEPIEPPTSFGRIEVVIDGIHRVDFALHGGVHEDAPIIQDVADGGFAERPAVDPRRPGYDFAGWWTTSEEVPGGQPFDFATMQINEPTTIHARWTPAVHTVTFNLHGGTATFPLTQSVTHNTTIAQPTPNPELAGHTFIRWINLDGTEFDFTLPIEGPTTIHADWEANVYTVTFNAAPGTFPLEGDVSTTTREVPHGVSIDATVAGMPGDPVRTGGYTFLSWWTGPNGTGTQVTGATLITDDMDVYPLWESPGHLTVSFNLQGGTGNFPAQQVLPGGFATKPTDEPTHENHTFDGWFTDPVGGVEFDFDNTPITVSRNIYAQWTPYPIITWNANGGAVTPATWTRAPGTALGVLPIPTRSGYDFIGWYTEAPAAPGGVPGGVRISETTLVPNADVTYHARWQAETIPPVTITWNANGGTVTPATWTRAPGTALGALPIPTRSGYDFIGWYAIAPAAPGGVPGGVRITPTTLVPNANVTYHARWEAEDVGGGIFIRFHFDNTHVDVPVTIGQPINSTLIPIPATRYGSIGTPAEVFMGWFEEITPLMHWVSNANRATAFNTNQTITQQLLDDLSDNVSGIPSLYGSWLQFGDVDGDGNVDGDDLIRLRQHLALMPVDIILLTADVDVSGNVDGDDLIRLRQHLALMPVVLGFPAP